MLGAPKLCLTKMVYMKLEEPLLAFKIKSLLSDAIKALKSLSYVVACISELCKRTLQKMKQGKLVAS